MGNHAFIDSQNLNLGIREQGWQLDFKRFRIYLKDKYGISDAFLFIGYIPEHQMLYTALQRYGYIVIFKPTMRLPNGKVKGNVDAELVLHTMIEYDNYEKAVIVTGDGDFSCLIEFLQENNKLLRLIIPDRKNYSALLSKHKPPITFMNSLKNKLSYRKQ